SKMSPSCGELRLQGPGFESARLSRFRSCSTTRALLASIRRSFTRLKGSPVLRSDRWGPWAVICVNDLGAGITALGLDCLRRTRAASRWFLAVTIAITRFWETQDLHTLLIHRALRPH